MNKVDPNEAPEGYMAVESLSCANCAFTYCDEDCVRSFCSDRDRKDGCIVIFVERPTTATASWPYDDMGTPVEVVE